ncbi:RDD family protein [Microbacterium sp. USHLN186]|uniref:RDD family protein n=1 Tax=Microbacterium sp. USHLN186 TaxID=3081286 RepID=UPI00301878F2
MIWEIDDGAKHVEGLDAAGRPDPAYAHALGLRPAPFGRRALATLVELVMLLLLALPAVVAAVPPVLAIADGRADPAAMLGRGELLWPIILVIIGNVLVTVFVIVQLVLHGRRGVTAGKAIFGLRTVNVRTLERPGFWRGAVVRYLLLGLSFLLPVLGPLLVVALSPLFDAERRGRGWLDQAGATWLVDARRALNPYDAKRMRIARKSVKTPQYGQRAPLPSLATPVDRDAPAQYTPSGRFSGGVIGAHRAAATTPATPVASAAAAMTDAVPPPLTSAAPPAAAAAAAAPDLDAVPPSDAGGIRAVLRLDDGSRIEVRGATLLGRAPAPVAGEGAVQLVPVADDTRSVSKTHLAVLPARRGVLVVDRGSTNGSSILREGAEIALRPGDPAPVQPGDTVRFGDRTLTVERA